MIAFLLLFLLIVRDQPLAPAWSPDHQVLATSKVSQTFVTPEGGDYVLLMNGKLIYPQKRRRSWFSTYEDQHTFLSNFAWSPDSQYLAFMEEVYNWEYNEPYNRYFDGTVSRKAYFLVIVSRAGSVRGYQIKAGTSDNEVAWQTATVVAADKLKFDISSDVPGPIR